MPPETGSPCMSAPSRGNPPSTSSIRAPGRCSAPSTFRQEPCVELPQRQRDRGPSSHHRGRRPRLQRRGRPLLWRRPVDPEGREPAARDLRQARPGRLSGRHRHRRQRAGARQPAARRGARSSATRPRTSPSTRPTRRSSTPAAPSWCTSTGRPARSTPGSSRSRSPSRCTAWSIIRSLPPSRSPRRPNAARPIRPTTSPRLRPRPIATA